MTDKGAVLLKEAVLITLVIMAFRTTFSMKGGHNTINPYFKNIPSEVRRNIHVVTTKILWNRSVHVKIMYTCDIYPTLLTSQVVLPSYQHFLQHLQLTGMTKLISNESDALSQYGKTILMLILARVKGYYNPYIPQTIMEEEAKLRYGDVFSPAEKGVLQTQITDSIPQRLMTRGVKTAIDFLELNRKQSTVHAQYTPEQRGYEWIIFRRQPDRKPCQQTLKMKMMKMM